MPQMPLDQVPPIDPAIEARVEALAADSRVQKALETVKEQVPFAIEEQIALSEIPAPTFHEEARAAELIKRLRAYGLTEISKDAMGNVLARRPGVGNGPAIGLCAHMDTVFPEGTDCTVRREGDRYVGPGIGDNASGLRNLLQILRSLQAANIETEGDLWFIGSVQEEGVGDICGAKALVKNGIHWDGFIALDGSDVGRIQRGATGEHSWRFIIDGPGGHSWGAFGEVPSAAHALARAVAEIADLEVPQTPRTTFTVGTITGGTTMTTIAPHCECELDFRSTSNEELMKVEAFIFNAFRRAVEKENARWGITDPEKQLKLSYKQIGDIPGGMRPDDCPVLQTARAAQKRLGIEMTRYETSSTDANPAMSLGIPSTCLSSGGVGVGAHTVDEYVVMDRIERGPQLALLTVLALSGISGFEPLLPKRG